jgi:EmrB/QacA subfamily drug resistance transporter
MGARKALKTYRQVGSGVKDGHHFHCSQSFSAPALPFTSVSAYLHQMDQLQHEKRNRTYTVLGIALAMFLGALDQTIVSTAMPKVVEELGGLDRLSWVFTIYILVSTLLIPLYGKLADIVSRKSLEIIAVATFIIGSALCGMAGEWPFFTFLGDGMTQLIVFRGLQALGGAGLFALAFIIVSDLYPPRERGKINGMFGAVFGLSSVLGPLIGGFLTDNAGAWLPPIEGWRWVFYVNLPLGLVALWFIITRMPRLQPPDNSHEVDFVSVGLMMATFFPLVFALQLDKNDHAWTSPEVLYELIGALVMGVIWVWHSLKVSAHPIIDLRQFKNHVFTTSNIASFFFGAGFFVVIQYLPFYMVNVQGVSATQAGASLIPMTMGVVLGSGLGGPLASKFGKYKAILVVGTIISMLAGALMMLFGLDTPYWQVLITMVIAGLGFGPGMGLYSLAVQNVTPREEMGQATSFSQFLRQIGSAIGSAIAGSIFSAAVLTASAAHMPAGMELNQGILRAGPTEVKKYIEAGFDTSGAQVAALMDLRGAEAQAAYDKLMADPNTSAQIKDNLKNGTPAMAMEAAFGKLETTLEGIVASGNKTALAALYASPAGAQLGADSRKGIDAIMNLPAEDREEAIPHLRDKMLQGMDLAINATSELVKAKTMAALDAKKSEVANDVVARMKPAVVEALAPIWLFNFVTFVLLFIANLFIPSIPLKSKQDGIPGEPAAPAASH